MNMLTAHKIAKSIEKKNGVTFPLMLNRFLSFFFISTRRFVSKNSSSKKISKFCYEPKDVLLILPRSIFLI